MPDRNARVWTGTGWELISAPISTPNAIATYQSTAPSSPVTGQIWIDSDDSLTYVWNGTAWVNSQALPSQVGQSGKYLKTSGTSASWEDPFASPTFTGIPSAPTAAVNTNTTQIATTAFVIGQGNNTSATITMNGTQAAGTSNLYARADHIHPVDTSRLSTSGGIISGNLTVNGIFDVNEFRETVVDITLVSNVATLNWTAGNIYYIATSPTANMTFNVTNVPTDNSKMMTINILVTQGATGYIPNTFQIDSVSQTIRWPGGSAPTPTSSAGKIDIFSFTMQRTSAGTWIVYGASSLNF